MEPEFVVITGGEVHDGIDREMYIHRYEYKTIYVKKHMEPLGKT